MLYPWVLLLLPLPLLVRWLLPPAKQLQASALVVPFYQRIRDCSQAESVNAPRLPALIMVLIWVLLLTAAAHPAWQGTPMPLEQRGRDIFLAIDISGSMEIPDMLLAGQAVDRLSAVKAVARDFIQARSGDRLGLILFGSRGYLQTPLTFDRKTVQAMLDDATPGLAGPQTAIGDAIGLAIKRLQTVKAPQKILILLTDGVNNAGAITPLTAAKLAAQQGIKIYTIGLGSQRVTVNGLFGSATVTPSAELDEKSLRDIAQLTAGRFFRANNSRELHQVYREIDRLEPVASDTALFYPIVPYYHWPLGLALLLSILLLGRSLWPQRPWREAQ